MKDLKTNLPDVKTVGQIYQTSDYSKFRTVEGNRDIYPSNVKKIKNSIMKCGYINSCAIICGLNPIDDGYPFIILDGNHRFVACKELGFPLVFTIYDNIDMNDTEAVKNLVVSLNTASKIWNSDDYMDMYCKLNDSSYILYKDLYETYDYEHDLYFHMISEYQGKTFETIHFKNRELNFTIKEYRHIEEKLKMFDEVCAIPHTDENNRTVPLVKKTGKRQFLKALYKYSTIDGFDFDHFMKKFKSSQNIARKCTNVNEAISLIASIYQRNMRIPLIKLSFNSKGVCEEITM